MTGSSIESDTARSSYVLHAASAVMHLHRDAMSRAIHFWSHSRAIHFGGLTLFALSHCGGSASRVPSSWEARIDSSKVRKLHASLSSVCVCVSASCRTRGTAPTFYRNRFSFAVLTLLALLLVCVRSALVPKDLQTAEFPLLLLLVRAQTTVRVYRTGCA